MVLFQSADIELKLPIYVDETLPDYSIVFPVKTKNTSVWPCINKPVNMQKIILKKSNTKTTNKGVKK